MDFYSKRSSWLIVNLFNVPQQVAEVVENDLHLPNLPNLSTFILKCLRRTRLPSEILVIVLALLIRLKSRWPAASSSAPAAGHRLFLAAFMLAFKSSIDDCYSNLSVVSLCQGFYDLQQINAMERELLILLDYQIHLNDDELSQVKSLFGQPPPRTQLTIDQKLSELSMLDGVSNTDKPTVSTSPIEIELKSTFSSPSTTTTMSTSLNSNEELNYYSSPDSISNCHPYAYPEFK